ncbi:MAG TPA: hypothetical protein PKD45_05310 [Flavobacteriales bacterium]|nr:hypothetical protein [Flavobacteriales bacterium]
MMLKIIALGTKEAKDNGFRMNNNLDIHDTLTGSIYKARQYKWWLDGNACNEGVYIFYLDGRRGLACLYVGPLKGPWPRDRVIAAAEWFLSQIGAQTVIPEAKLPECVLAWRYGNRLDEARRMLELGR